MDEQRWIRWLHFGPDKRICIGRGMPIRTLSDALTLPWTSPGGARSTIEQVAAAWATVLALKDHPPSVNEMRARTSIRLEQY